MICGKEYQGEATLFVFLPAHFAHAQLVAVEVERGVDIGDPNHGV
jgi:hypothetical protein